MSEEDLRPFKLRRDTGASGGLGGDAPNIQLPPRGDEAVLPLPVNPPKEPPAAEPAAPSFPQPFPGTGTPPTQPLSKLPGTPITLPPAPKKPGGGPPSP